jgi:hypothetical protein
MRESSGHTPQAIAARAARGADTAAPDSERPPRACPETHSIRLPEPCVRHWRGASRRGRVAAWSRPSGSTRPAAPALSKPAGPVGAKSPGCDTGATISAAMAGRRRRRFKSRIGAAARPNISPCPLATGGGPWCRSGSPTSHPTHCVAGSRPCRTGRVTREPSPAAADRAPRAPSALTVPRRNSERSGSQAGAFPR